MRLVVVIAGIVMMAGDSQQRELRAADPEKVWLGAEFGQYRRNGYYALQRGDYRVAIREYTAGAEAARQRRDLISRGRFLTNLSGAYLLQFDNRNAIQALLAARAAAGEGQDLATLQTVEASLANVYIQTGDAAAAAAAALRGAALHPKQQVPESRITILLSFGRAISRARGLAAAEPTIREAYREAERLGLTALEAEVLDLWGNEAMELDALAEAEDLLARAWGKRRLAKDPRISLTEGKLGRLYRKMGRYDMARMWMDRVRAAVASGKKIPIPEWVLMAEQGHVSAGEGNLREALGSYREAVEWARRWRRALPPAERLRLGGERRLQELFDGYLRTAARLYREKADRNLSAEMFTLIQTTRAWSMEKNGEGGQAGEALYAKARRLEGRWLGGDAGAAEELRVVRAAILEEESAAGEEGQDAGGRLEAPGDGEMVLTYWLDEEASWLLAWSQRGLRLTLLPGRAQILREAEAFRRAVAENRQDMGETGERLMGTLLGDLRAECLRAKRWDVVADEGLFGVPFAALPLGNGAYLMEKVELRLVPNALRWEGKKTGTRRFLAVADPIFNEADERRKAEWRWQRPVHAGTAATALPRLPGTRREAEAARGIWKRRGYETAVQLGAESSEEAVLARMGEWQPGIIHMATHTVTPANDQARPRLALSLRGDGSPGLLAAEDIAAIPLRAELVVMSACRSAGEETARGAGLLGLTRAWLTGGARQVVATLWPVADESTVFFEEFYERLAEGDGESSLPAAAALRQAQMACLRAGGSGAEPRSWAGHVLLARR
jgi:CHAT domain-containing protein